MRVTLSLRNQYERVEQGRAIPVPAPKEPDTDDLLDRFLVIGTPDTVIRQIKRVEELVGITHFNCSFWFGDLEHARVMKSMERFAREVLPARADGGDRISSFDIAMTWVTRATGTSCVTPSQPSQVSVSARVPPAKFRCRTPAVLDETNLLT